jgi:hypothetical protein
MPFSGMWRLIGIVRNGVSVELTTQFFRVERVHGIGTALAIGYQTSLH